MTEDSRETRGGLREAGAEGTGRRGGPPRLAMLFSATGWTFNVRLGKSGREEGEGIIIMGEVSYRTPAGERRVNPARAMVVKSDARKRLDLVLAAAGGGAHHPARAFRHAAPAGSATDLVSGYGMAVRIGFTAEESAERQGLEAVDFAFSSAPRSGPLPRAAQTGERTA